MKHAAVRQSFAMIAVVEVVSMSKYMGLGILRRHYSKLDPVSTTFGDNVACKRKLKKLKPWLRH